MLLIKESLERVNDVWSILRTTLGGSTQDQLGACLTFGLVFFFCTNNSCYENMYCFLCAEKVRVESVCKEQKEIVG